MKFFLWYTALFSIMFCSVVAAEEPSIAKLHAYKAYHHAEYMKETAAEAGGTNTFVHTTELPTEGTDPVVTPALDHLYSKAVIDLTNGPVYLEVPTVPRERYFSIHVTDQEHYTIYDEIRPAGKFVFIREGYKGKLQPDAKVIASPGDYPHLFVRVQVKTPEDRPNSLAIQKKLKLSGVSKTLKYDNAIQFTIDTHSIYPENAGLLAAVVDYSAEDHKELFSWVGQYFATEVKDNLGMFGPIDSKEQGANDPKVRAAAIVGHLGLPADHAYYTGIFTQCNGDRLNGSTPYTVTLPYEANVEEFWSITRYSALTRNTLPGKQDVYNAYNTKPNADGNINVTFSVEDPKDGSYWMPVNADEPYYYVERFYRPNGKIVTTQDFCDNPKGIETRIGKLEFEAGYPSKETAEKLYDELDFQRAVQSFLWSYPAVSFQSFYEGFKRVGIDYFDFAVFENFADASGIYLTANTTTIYGLTHFNLGQSGPVIIEIPKGHLVGMIDDYWQRSVTDVGLAGPYKGKGGKILVLPPGHNQEISYEGYHVVQATQNTHNFMIRGIVQGDDIQGAVNMIKSVRAYPWSARKSPKPNHFTNTTGMAVDTGTPKGMEYWKSLARFINDNPVETRDRFYLAMLRFLGMEKDQEFKPDARQIKILEEAMVVGEAMARASLYEPRIPGATVWPDRDWKWAVLLNADQESEFYTQLDERLHWFFGAIYMTPAMALKEAGPGSQYVQTFKDENGGWLTGSNNYRLRIPANAPAKDFWSLTVYDNETRSLVQNKTMSPAVSSYDDLKVNDDGSVDLYFGPNAPKGWEANWTETLPGKGFFLWFRVYHPTEAFFDGSWKLNNVEKIE